MATKAASKKGRPLEPLAPRRLTLRISLRGIEPEIWREISIPDHYSLLELHRCIQLVFGWLDYHLFEFQIGAQRFVSPHTEEESESDWADLTSVSELRLGRGDRLFYIYDFGDDWEHEIEVTGVADIPPEEEDNVLAYLHGGQRAAPPEDCGGAPGYARLLAALTGDEGDQDAADLREWLGGDFDAELFDRRATSHALMLATAWGVI